MKASALTVGLLLLVLAGCKTWATKEDFTWTFRAPERIRLGQDFTFVAEPRNAQGEVQLDVFFYWSIDWVGVPGSRHKGRSLHTLDLRSKGAPGTATLRIFGYDREGELVVLAQHPFQVE